MNAAERILVALDVRDSASGMQLRAPPNDGATLFEPVVVAGGAATFGVSSLTLAGDQASISDLQDLINLWAYRMGELDKSWAAARAAWQSKNAAAAADWASDYQALRGRYNTALSVAQGALTGAKLQILTPNALIPAGAQYTALAKAMRQCYPPDGCPVAKGDWEDLVSRLQAAGGAVADHPPQPQAVDYGQQAYADTASLDVIAQLTGQEQPRLPGLGSLAHFLAWTKAHKKLLVVGGVVMAGGVALAYLAPALHVVMLPFKAAGKAAAAVAA